MCDADKTPLEALAALATCYGSTADGKPTIGLPFLPLEVQPATDGCPAFWRYSCPILTPDGRCGDYENRPSLCASYRPGQDGLCAIYRKSPDPDAIPKQPFSEAA